MEDRVVVSTTLLRICQ